MARKFRKSKVYIIVFCEGESEQAYIDFLRKKFNDYAVMNPSIGLFKEAAAKLRNDARFRENAEVTDEIWFIYDVEEKDKHDLEYRKKVIKKLRSLRKNPPIRIRLLLTTGCIEYWFLLHYELLAPSIQTVAEKERIMNRLTKKEASYKKGDLKVISRIAENYPVAIENARKTVANLLSKGLPSLEDTDERNQWLCEKCFTFSTVYEAIEFLEKL